MHGPCKKRARDGVPPSLAFNRLNMAPPIVVRTRSSRGGAFFSFAGVWGKGVSPARFDESITRGLKGAFQRVCLYTCGEAFHWLMRYNEEIFLFDRAVQVQFSINKYCKHFFYFLCDILARILAHTYSVLETLK